MHKMSMADPVPTSVATLTCLCGAVSLPGSILSHPSFPIPTGICHCNPCRYVSGGLAPSFPFLKTAPPAEILKKLTKYASSERCHRFFCTTCGSHVFVQHPLKDNEWYCNGGIIDLPDSSPVKDVIQVASHAYIDDTADGGVAPLLFLQGSSDALFPAEPGKDSVSAERVLDMVRQALKHPLPSLEDELPVKCHCGGISMLVDRANHAENHLKVDPQMIPSNPNKYYAWYCTCRSCRLATGYSLQPMAYIRRGAIKNAHTGKPVVFGDAALQLGVNEGLKLGHYRHTDQAQRSFCSGCGATVFWCDLSDDVDDADGIVDISAGILRAESGAMAREWLEWSEGYISHEEEMLDKTQRECVKKGWKALGLAQ